MTRHATAHKVETQTCFEWHRSLRDPIRQAQKKSVLPQLYEQLPVEWAYYNRGGAEATAVCCFATAPQTASILDSHAFTLFSISCMAWPQLAKVSMSEGSFGCALSLSRTAMVAS